MPGVSALVVARLSTDGAPSAPAVDSCGKIVRDGTVLRQVRPWRERREVGMSDNIARLEAEGLIKNTPLPEPYKSVVEGLSAREVEVIVSVAQRLQTDVRAHAIDDTPPVDEFFVAL
jgi:hypothetical protein